MSSLPQRQDRGGKRVGKRKKAAKHSLESLQKARKTQEKRKALWPQPKNYNGWLGLKVSMTSIFS